ncbi:SPOR domain-containing protein [Methyloligella sp. 2.7D]|uniref:SPOR domain-containing protein n=1 Tax=unclassified Methyloligella TaxID=2625955 RepID=UPI00157D9F09|nr:SPOR domain-containing protein [Methyloligella sp. GL2]QKP77670.1 SPOR domain-containing protein [Methyloligella sp. GL2]
MASSVFAIFWVVLAGFAGAYLFSVMTELPKAAATAPVIQRVTVPDKKETAELKEALKAREAEVAELKAQLATVTEQLGNVDRRLAPIEKLLGPVAAMPEHDSAVTTAPPTPDPAPIETPASPPPPAPKPDAPDRSEAETPAPAPQAEAEVEPEPAPAPKPKPEPKETAVPSGNVPEPASEPVEEAEAPAVAPPPPPPPGGELTEEPTRTAALNVTDLPPGTNRFGIELGAVDSASGLQPMWRNLLTKHAALVAGLEARRVKAPDNQWRLVAGPFSSATEASRACALFKKAELPCEPTVFAGDAL